MGNQTTETNAGDVPASDGNPCHQPVCNGSTPGQASRGQGTSCGGGMVCDANGSCCTPLTCSGQTNCAPISDNCGGSLGACVSCASMGAQYSCTGNACVCTPKTVDDCVQDCGPMANGCGGTVTCPNTCLDQGEKCTGTICVPICFAAGTRITMADGTTQAIETIRVGERVVTFDPATSSLGEGTVTETFAHDAEQSTSGTLLINGDLEATPNHPFFSGGAWVRADQLRVGGELLELASSGATMLSASTGSVRSIAARPGHIRTFNLEVEGAHDYFANGVLVHNKIPP
jgi:hypothetical protein